MTTSYEELNSFPPQEIEAGNTVEWVQKSEVYTPDDGFYVQIALTNATTAYTLTASSYVTSIESFQIEVPASTTSGFTAGDYKLHVYATDDTDRYKLGEYTVAVLPDPTAGAHDYRSTAKKTLEALDAAIQGSASSNQLSMSIAGRSISRHSMEELIMARDRYAQLVAQEERAEALMRGEKPKNRIRLRFT